MAGIKISLVLVFSIIVNCCVDVGSLLCVDNTIPVQLCMQQDPKRQPVIIDTDAAVDDLWAILYALNVSQSMKNDCILGVFVIIYVEGANN
jgi:hypothetical protein